MVVAAVAVLMVLFPLASWVMSRAENVGKEQAPAAARPGAADHSAETVGPSKCTNKRAGYTVRVPATWMRATVDDAECTSFVVPMKDSFDEASLQIAPDVGRFDDAEVKGDVTKERQGNIAGRPATYYEGRFTNQGAAFRAYGYILDSDGRAFSVGLVTPDGVSVPKSTRKTFDEVVRQIEFKD